PDLATSPLSLVGRTLERLLQLRAYAADPLPTLIVATTDARVDGWNRLLDTAARGGGEAPLVAHVGSWRGLRSGDLQPTPATHSRAFQPARHLQVRSLVPRLSGSRIPHPVGSDFGSRSPNVRRLLALKSMDRDLLDLVGRHPFLSSASLATVLGWETRRLRERLIRLLRL